MCITDMRVRSVERIDQLFTTCFATSFVPIHCVRDTDPGEERLNEYPTERMFGCQAKEAGRLRLLA
jgi:hypothetical protein